MHIINPLKYFSVLFYFVSTFTVCSMLFYCIYTLSLFNYIFMDCAV